MSKNIKKNFGEKRMFLNPKTGVAAASFQINTEYSLDAVNKWIEVNSYLELSDCSRKISLEFDLVSCNAKSKAGKLKALKDRRAKLLRLKQIIDEFVETTSKAYDHYESLVNKHWTNEPKKERKK